LEDRGGGNSPRAEIHVRAARGRSVLGFVGLTGPGRGRDNGTAKANRGEGKQRERRGSGTAVDSIHSAGQGKETGEGERIGGSRDWFQNKETKDQVFLNLGYSHKKRVRRTFKMGCACDCR